MSKSLKNSFLNQWEVEQNLLAIKKIINESIKESRVLDAAKAAADYQQNAESLLQVLNEFSTDHKITFSNLIACDIAQYHALKKLILTALANDLQQAQVMAQFQKLLQEWEKTLVESVPGRGVLSQMHNAHAASFASGLASGAMPFNQWGTDIDIADCLQNAITDPSKIKASGTYILSPGVITEPEEVIPLHPAGAAVERLVNIQQKIAAALEEIQLSKVRGPVSLRIPVNSLSDSHWRLVKIDINDGKIISARLWDSFSGPNSLDFNQALQNLQRAINHCTNASSVVVKPFFANTQTNNYSCMDLVIQEATKEKNNAIQVAGKDLSALRIAVLQQIARNHPKLGAAVAANLTVEDNMVKVTLPKQTEDDELPEIKKSEFLGLLLRDKKSQVEFDEIFAKKLAQFDKQQQHRPNTPDDDALLETKAFRAAYKEFSFFVAARPAKSEVGIENPQVHAAAPSA